MTFRTIATRLLTAATLAAPLAMPAIVEAQSPPPAETASPMKPRQVTDIGIHGACWILDGTLADYRLHGSGWILDAKKRLIVTNDHVVGGHDTVTVFFPTWEGGKVNSDPQHYLKDLKPHTAIVIDRSKNRDLALLQVDDVPTEMKELKLAKQSAEEGDLLRTVGALPNGNEALWGTVSGEVRLVAPRNHPNGGRCMMVTTTIPTNAGNSGGAILNDRGEVVAVVEGGYDGPNAQGRMVLSVTMHVDLSVIKDFLAEALPLVEPTDAAAFLKRAELRLAAGRVDVASADFSEAIKRDKKNAKAFLGRGRTFVAKGDRTTAISDFTDAIAIDDQSFDAFIARGKAQAATGKIDEAVADMTKAIRINPNSVHGYNERGNVEHNAKKFSAAVEDYTRAIKISPNDPVLWANRANSFEQMKKASEAIADRQHVTELQPNAPWRWSELGRTYLWTAKQYDNALSSFKKAAQLNPKEPIHVADIGDTLLEAGQFDKANAAFTESLDLNRQVPSLNLSYTHLRRGVARKGAKDVDGALADFTTAIKINPKYAVAYLQRGKLLMAAGKDEAGQADLDQAAKLNPAFASEKTETRTETKKAKGLTLLGTWEFNGTINGRPFFERNTFYADGTMTTILKGRRADGYYVDLEDTGTYKIEGKAVTVSMKQIGVVVATVVRTGNSLKATLEDGTTIPYTQVK